jgi:type II restriction enzyme
VDTVFAVPPWAITPTMVTQRPPLKPTARRAGWVGATLQLAQVPSTCRVTFVESGALRSATAVQADWARTAFLAEPRAAQSRGWTLDVLRVVESLGPGTFTLAQVYAHAPELQAAHPDNHHVHDKIRQQLQVLRDRRLLRFLGGGRYALTASATP